MTQPYCARDIETWLLTEGVRLELAALVSGLGHRLSNLGLPVDRLGLSFFLLNPSLLAGGIIWRPDRPLDFRTYAYAERDTGQYDRSPLKAAHERGDWVELDLARTPDNAYGIVPELKAEGLAHYIAVPLPDSAGDLIAATLGTRSPEGFSEEDRAAFATIAPALTAVVEIKRLRSTFRDVLGAYVGRSPAREIASGTVHRGQITEVRAAIFVADLRGFTHLSTRLPPAATADVINRYYDLVVPPVEDLGGEVLKFIGDAVLAIFPVADIGDESATLAGLDAARRILAAEPAPIDVAGHKIPVRLGIALHLGDAVYGNVGSGDRLDFTVIGRDVNVAARISTLCSLLGQDVLVSETVADIGRADGRLMADAGAHPVRGLEAPLRVFVPDRTEVDAEIDDGVSQGPVFVNPA